MPTKSAVFVAFLAATISTYGQGWILFNTRTTGQRITASDGITPLDGDAYLAQIYASATVDGILEPIGKATPFRRGVNVGYIVAPAAEQAVLAPSVTNGGPTYLQIRAWDSQYSSYETAVADGGAAGASKIWTQGTALDIIQGPPPLEITGFEAFSIGIPEPSMLALLGIGAAGLLLSRRR